MKYLRVVVSDPQFEPTKAYPSDAGYDLFVSEPVTVQPGQFLDVPLGIIRVLLPIGTWARLVGRSSTLRSRGLLVAEGVIDGGYTGPLFAGVFNLTNTAVSLAVGDRIAQLILCPTIDVPVAQTAEHDIPQTDRGTRGFGSSGGHGRPQ